MTKVPEIWFLIFAAATALAVLIQTALIAGMAFALFETRKQLLAFTKRIERDVMPVVGTVRGVVDDAAPKVKQSVEHLQEIVQTLKLQVNHVNKTVGHVVDKTQAQADRVDGIFTGVLNGVAHATDTVQNVVAAGGRQVAGVVSGLRVGFDVLRRKERETYARNDRPYPKAEGSYVRTEGSPARPDSEHFV